jgi:hypothetical protein
MEMADNTSSYGKIGARGVQRTSNQQQTVSSSSTDFGPQIESFSSVVILCGGDVFFSKSMNYDENHGNFWGYFPDISRIYFDNFSK